MQRVLGAVREPKAPAVVRGPKEPVELQHIRLGMPTTINSTAPREEYSFDHTSRSRGGARGRRRATSSVNGVLNAAFLLDDIHDKLARLLVFQLALLHTGSLEELAPLGRNIPDLETTLGRPSNGAFVTEIARVRDGKVRRGTVVATNHLLSTLANGAKRVLELLSRLATLANTAFCARRRGGLNC